MEPGQPILEHGEDPGFLERLGRALGSDFEVLGLLGRGGFADVYQIRDGRLDRTLAVKVLRPGIAWGPWMISRFEREARALANLNHLNIPPVHFVGDNEGLLYYVMPLIAGRSLGDALAERGALDARTVVEVMISILDALHHAHHLGIVHRDIKPDNIVIEEETNRPLLVDFGVAKQVKAGPPGSSLPGVIAGTPGYMSPEQAVGQDDIDARSDVYAIGASMVHLLTGSILVPDDNVEDRLGNGPLWLSAVVLRAIAANRDDRYQTAADMAEALRIGRRSGELGPGARLEAIEQIRDDDPTPKMVPAAVRAEVIPPWEKRTVSRRRRVRGPGRPSPFSWPLFLGLAGAVAAYFLFVPVTLTLRNNLLVPIEFSTGGGTILTIAPGGDLSVHLSPDERIMGRWFAVQPRSDPLQRQVGEPVGGMIRVDALTAPELLIRRVRRSIDSWSDGSVVFAPRVRNGGSRPVRVTVSRLGGGAHCECLIEPGEVRLLGYYRLESSSFIRMEAGGKSFVVRNLESRLDLNSGILDLNVSDTTAFN